MDSTFWMDRALSLACRGLGVTAPNPAVGAVLVKNGRLIGEGFHRGPGQAHAEAAALDDALAKGHEVRGSTLYVTLEPCCHDGHFKRTPPCAQRLVAEGVAEVWAAVADPNPLVSGRGRALLVEAGITFHWGPKPEEARELIADFSTWIERRRPFVTLKWAQSLDGRRDHPQPESRWITGAASRAEVHRQRSQYDTVAVGAGTLRTDDPSLTVRDAPLGPSGQPRRLLFAGSRPLPEDAKLFTDAYRESTWIVCSPSSEIWPQAQALVGDRVVPWDGSDPALLGDLLLKAGFYRIYVEGGPSLLESLLKWNFWDRMEVFTAPALLSNTPLVLAEPRWRVFGQDTLLEAWNPAVTCSQV